jgi:hypothetical protein
MQMWDRRDRKSRRLKTGVHRSLRMNRGKRLSTGLRAHKVGFGKVRGLCGDGAVAREPIGRVRP